MAATAYKRLVFRGDTLFFLDAVYQDVTTRELFTVPVTSPPTPPPPTAVPFDLTEANGIWFTAKKTVVDPDESAVFVASVNDGVTITGAVSGQFTVSAVGTATFGFPDGPVDLVYDIQIQDGVGRIFTVETGVLTVVPDVSRVYSAY